MASSPSPSLKISEYMNTQISTSLAVAQNMPPIALQFHSQCIYTGGLKAALFKSDFEQRKCTLPAMNWKTALVSDSVRTSF